MSLHVSDLQHATGAIAGRRDAVAASKRQRQRLFAQHMEAPFQGGNGQVRMQCIRRRDHDGIQIAGEQLLQFRVHMLQPVALPQRLAHRGRCVGQCDKVEASALFPQIERMLRLAHEAGAHQSDA